MRDQLESVYEAIYHRLRARVRAAHGPESGVVCFASGLQSDPNDPARATFSLAVRHLGVGRTFYLTLAGASVSIRERDEPDLLFPDSEQACGHLLALADELLSRPLDAWGR